MTTLHTVDPAIAAFAASVREQLNDLTTDEIDDLTDGLEADLSDQAADDDAPALGDPADYADELRSAAGLDARESAQRPPLIDLAGMRHTLASARDAASRYIHARPALAALVAFVVSLRPLWWVARGVAIYAALITFFTLANFGFMHALVVAAFVVLSIQWGRGRWMPWPWVRGVKYASNVLALIAIPVIVSLAVGALLPQAYEDDYLPVGLMNGEEYVSNIFAYDADGNPIVDVQLFDQDGNPLSTYTESMGDEFLSTESADGELLMLVRRLTVSSIGGWNVYPLQTAPYSDSVNLSPVGEAKLPFSQVAPLLKLEKDSAPENVPTSAPTNPAP